MQKRFQKKVEDFVCEKCGTEIKGNGYTNHCPHCLWSKHVDVNPGDRAATCGAMMKPIEVENRKGEWVITHECTICGHIKKNGLSAQDNMDVLAIIAKAQAEKLSK